MCLTNEQLAGADFGGTELPAHVPAWLQGFDKEKLLPAMLWELGQTYLPIHAEEFWELVPSNIEVPDALKAPYFRMLLRQLHSSGCSDLETAFKDAPINCEPEEINRSSEWHVRIAATEVRTHRVFFPVVNRGHDKGWIVAAVISAVRAVEGEDEDGERKDGEDEDTVQLAPWSFFELDEASWDNTRDAIKDIDGIKGKTFLVDLQPLVTDDVSLAGDLAAQRIAAWDLTPDAFVITGQSLGLAIALAISATGQELCVESVVATGKLNNKGAINSVDGIPAKLDAARLLVENSPEVSRILLPETISGDKPDDVATRLEELRVGWQTAREQRPGLSFQELVLQKKTLNDLLKAGVLTDGFDRLRNQLLSQVSTEIEPKPGVESLAEDVVRLLASNLVKDQLEWTSNFGESTNEQADYLLSNAVENWWKRIKEAARITATKLVPIDVERLVKSSLETSVSLPKLLCACIDCDPQALPTIDALEIVLRQPGKLLFVVHDAPSIELAGCEEPEFRRRQALWRHLRLLASGEHDEYQQQCVVTFFSDYHHKLMWEQAAEKQEVS
ncbi:hypothetical protein [Adhaeretor mobilis]|uniref:Uncharacterized protein n=1 Tax=Adhaeretor mobilis TaxID=1930276 RepID=A0A517MQP6_9BACT|nr:hypothetical protein [Adhaeretor mobilis]QDS97208.1 hypothetical protein HG15A2_04680 [Adhaeretor mobilis]